MPKGKRDTLSLMMLDSAKRSKAMLDGKADPGSMTVYDYRLLGGKP